MPVPKVLGIETEYGVAGGPDGDPITASALIVNAYAQQGRTRLTWDFTHESPGNDARGGAYPFALAPAIETELANTVLTNGARLYVDHAHPEYSSPEVRTPLDALLYDLAGEEVMRRALVAVNETLPPELHIRLYKNNSDGKGNSYGTHENYLVDRSVPFDDLVRGLLPHFISRQIIVGAGKVGAETETARGYGTTFQVSARAEFFEEVVGLETTLKRPIINTRDEPHADATRFRRLHVINGDASMSQTATWLKVGVTSLLLAYIETCGISVLPPPPDRPVSAFRAFARDLSLTVGVDAAGSSWTALAYQERLHDILARFAAEHDTSDVGPDDQVQSILTSWRSIMDGLHQDRDRLADRVDWIAKLRLVEGYRERHQLAFGDARLKLIDLQYHDIRKEKSLAARAGLRTLVALDEIAAAVHEPPHDTRAFFRGSCVSKFPNELVNANWDSLVFDTGSGPLQRLEMPHPLRGTEALVGAALAKAQTAADLLVALTD